MTANILEGFAKEADFAKANGLTVRSIERYRELGLPWMKWGREIWIDIEGGREWLRSRVRRSGFDPANLRPMGFKHLERNKGGAPDGSP